MKLVRFATAALNQTPLDWDGNLARIVQALNEARQSDASILCLPELCISGYSCEDMFYSPGVHAQALSALEDLLPETRGLVVTFGLPLVYQKALYNVACLAVDGRALGFVAKHFLAGGGVHYEPRWFSPWPADLRVEIDFGGNRVPLGDYVFDCGGVRLGFEICEDAWVAQRPGAALAARGVDVILNPSASHFAFGKQEVRKRYVVEGSRAFGVVYVYSNLLGNEAGRVIYDGGTLIASDGRLVAEGRRFSYEDVVVTTAVVDLTDNRVAQAQTASYRPDLAGGGAIVAGIELPVLVPEVEHTERPDWETSGRLKEEEFWRAVGLGLFDYLRKSRARGFVVSLSGGADSSAVSCLVALMAGAALAELGAERLRTKLAHIGGTGACATVPDWVERLLVCAYQSTRQSSEETREAARSVATALGARFIELDVDPLVQGYVQLIELATGQTLNWDDHDVPLQNIQARVRAPSVWLLANLGGALLLSTSNRSEAAVGYATMDGDTAGGLSPIAGIDKAFLRDWLAWLEATGPDGMQAIPALGAVNAQVPTAELRPPGHQQTDEDDLMPYAVLDAIEGAAIGDKEMPRAVYLEMRARFPEYAPRTMLEFVERFFRLWAQNQWKRERYAPSFHLDDKNLDPKTWCRFPILSGGFEHELRELRAWVESEGVD